MWYTNAKEATNKAASFAFINNFKLIIGCGVGNLVPALFPFHGRKL
jgi:hypothetical protein